MKKILFLLFFVPILFSSCEKDDEPNQNYTSNTNNNNNNSNTDCVINVSVTAGDYPSEISWAIVDPSSETILASAGAPYSGAVCIPNAHLGDLNFRMYDALADGWDGSEFTLSGNSTLTGTLTGTLIDGDFGSENFSVTGGDPCTPVGGNDIDPQDLIGEWNIDEFIVDGNSLFSPNNPMSNSYIISMQFLFQNTGQVIVTQLTSDDPSANVVYDQWSVSSIGSVNMLDIVHADGSEEHWTIVELTDTYMELTLEMDGITAVIYASKL